MRRVPSLLAWVQPRSARDLERFWRSAARWAGGNFLLDVILTHLREHLDRAAAHEWPRAFQAMALRAARRDAWWTWMRITDLLGYATRSGHTTALGRQVARELARAAKIDGGLGTGLSRDDRVQSVVRPMPTSDEARPCCDFDLTIPAHGEAVEFAPAPCDGWDSLMIGGDDAATPTV